MLVNDRRDVDRGGGFGGRALVLGVTGTGVTDLAITAQTVLAPPNVLCDETFVTWRQGADHLHFTDLPGVDRSQQGGQGRGSLTDDENRCGT